MKHKLILISCLNLISCTKQNYESVDIMFLKQVNITFNYSMFEKVYYADDKFLITFTGNNQANTLVEIELLSILQNSIYFVREGADTSSKIDKTIGFQNDNSKSIIGISDFYHYRNGYFDSYSLKYDQSTNNEGGYFAKVIFTKEAISDCSNFNEILASPSIYDLYIKFKDYSAYSKYHDLFEYFKS